MASVSGSTPRSRVLHQHHRRGGVGDHERQPVGRVLRVQRQVGAAGLEHAEQRRRPARPSAPRRPPTRVSGPTPARAQPVRHPVGRRVQLGVGQPNARRTAPRPRPGCGRPAPRSGRAASRRSGKSAAVSFQPSPPAPARRRRSRSSAETGRSGRGDHRAQQGAEPGRHPLDGGPVEQVGVEDQLAPQAVAGLDQRAARSRTGWPAAPSGSSRTPRRRRSEAAGRTGPSRSSAARTSPGTPASG